MPWLSTALDLIGDVLSLRAGFALAAAEVAGVGRIAVAVAILAGLSEAVGESVVLFVNRVKPAHFVRSLLISALIFAITYLFLAASIWAVATFVLGADGSFGSIAAVVALAQAPRLFGFLAFLPYFGLPISVLLWIWSLLATTSGVAALLQLAPWEAAVAVMLGGLLLLTLQRTVGRPLLALARLVRARAAGVQLVTDRRKLSALIDGAPDPGLAPPRAERRARPRR